MAQYGKIEEQLVQPNQPVTLNDVISCNKGYVLHRNGSGILTLRGCVNNPSCCFARYEIIFKGNIAVPEDGTVGPISVAIAIDGEVDQLSLAEITPAAVDEYFNVVCTAIINIPRGCCQNISIENTSASVTPATTPAPAINVRNANLIITRIA